MAGKDYGMTKKDIQAASGMAKASGVKNVGGIPRDASGKYVGPFSSAYEHSEALSGAMGNAAAATAAQATHSAGLREKGIRDTSRFGTNAGILAMLGVGKPEYARPEDNPLYAYKPASVLAREAQNEFLRKQQGLSGLRPGGIFAMLPQIARAFGDVPGNISRAIKLQLTGGDPEKLKEAGFTERDYEAFKAGAKQRALEDRFNEMIRDTGGSGRAQLMETTEDSGTEDSESEETDFYPDDLLVAKALDPAALTPYTQPLSTLGVPVNALLPGNIFSESDPYYNYYT